MTGHDDMQPLSTTRVDGAVATLADVVAGIARSDKGDYVQSLAKLYRALRGGALFKGFSVEWERYRKKGMVKDDYQDTEQAKACLQELLDALEDPGTDEARFRVLKAIFLTAATESHSSRTSVLPQQYMSICRTLASGEVLLLHASWARAKSKLIPRGPLGASEWLEHAAREAGLMHGELAAIHEQNLMAKQLLTSRTYGDRSGVVIGEHDRLTSLGIAICKFIEEYGKNSAI